MMWVDLVNTNIEFLVSLWLGFWLQNIVKTKWGSPLDTNLTKWLSKCESYLQIEKGKETHNEQMETKITH